MSPFVPKHRCSYSGCAMLIIAGYSRSEKHQFISSEKWVGYEDRDRGEVTAQNGDGEERVPQVGSAVLMSPKMNVWMATRSRARERHGQ